MRYPSLSEYNTAVFSPRTAFADPELRLGRAAQGGLGMPFVLSGGCALTYRFRLPGGRSRAVRVFQDERPGRKERYAAVSAWLNEAVGKPGGGCWVKTEYQAEGIRVGGNRFPLVKMDWVRGKTLGALLEEQHGNAAVVTILRRRLAGLAARLESCDVVHGDVQNGNVFWTGGGLRLIDYDGMSVPGLEGCAGLESGHPNFQHPGRTAENGGPAVDRFSFILYDVSLRAVAVDATLFPRFSTGENVLFSRTDLLAPESSPVFRVLEGVDGLRSFIDLFRRICRSPLAEAPSLAEYAAEGEAGAGFAVPARGSDESMPSPPAESTLVEATEEFRSVAAPVSAGVESDGRFPPYMGPYRIFAAGDYQGLCRAAGRRVEAVGRIAEVKNGLTRHGKPYVFINFGFWRSDIFRITIWAEGLGAFRTRPDESWIDGWISVTGLVDEPYHNEKFGYTHAGITVHDPSQVRLLSAGEASHRLGTAGAEAGSGARIGAPDSPVDAAANPAERPERPRPTNADLLSSLGRGAGPVVRKPADSQDRFRPPGAFRPNGTVRRLLIRIFSGAVVLGLVWIVLRVLLR